MLILIRCIEVFIEDKSLIYCFPFVLHWLFTHTHTHKKKDVKSKFILRFSLKLQYIFFFINCFASKTSKHNVDNS